MAERSPRAARDDRARHIALVCKYIARQGPSFEPIAIERHARAPGFEFLNPTPDATRGDGDDARDDDDARATYEKARDEAIREYDARRRRTDAAIERGVREEMTREGQRDGDAEAVVATFTGRGSDDGACGMTIEDAMDAVVRAREIAERLFASGPAETGATGRDGETATRETETVVVDFERDGETTTKRVSGFVDGDDDDAMDFNALVEGFVREEEEADEDEDEDEPRTAAETGVATTTATAAAAKEGARANQVEEAAPGAGDRVEEPAFDLTMMFPSSKRKPMGDLAGFDQVMKVKKPRQKRKPKPKYDPTPSLLDDDLVAIAPAVKDVVDDFIAEDDYDNIEAPQDAGEVEEDDEIAETDVEDSPQVTEVRAEFLFPSSVPKKKTSEKEEETLRAAEEEVTQTQRATNEETEAVAPTEDVAMKDGEDDEEVAQPEVEGIHASTDDETSIAHWNSESNSPGDAVDMPALVPAPAPAPAPHAALPGKLLEKIARTTIPNDPVCLSAEATLGKQTLTCSYCHTYQAVKSVGFYAHERACKKRLEKEKNTLTCPHCQVYTSAKGAGFAAHERVCKRKHEQGTFSPVVVQPVQNTERGTSAKLEQVRREKIQAQTQQVQHVAAKEVLKCSFCDVFEAVKGAGFAAHERACKKKHEMDAKMLTCSHCRVYKSMKGAGFAAHERACKKKREGAQLPTSTLVPSSPPAAPRTQLPLSSTPAKEPLTCSHCGTFKGAPGAGFAAHERACKKKREGAQLPTSTLVPSSPPAPRTQLPLSSTPAKEPLTCSHCGTFKGAPGAGFAAHERACKKKHEMDAKMLTCSHCRVYKSMKGAGFAAHERACKKKREGAQLPTSTLCRHRRRLRVRNCR